MKTFSYQYSPVTITATPGEGKQTEGVRVELNCSADYAQLSYRLDDGEEQPYTGPVVIVYSGTLTAYARYNGKLLATETFTYEIPFVEVQLTPKDGTSYNGIQFISLDCNWEHAEFYYHLDAWDNEEYVPYTGPFELDHTDIISVKTGIWGKIADVRSFYYELHLPRVTASPQPGDLKAPLSVTLSIQEEYQDGYNIYYTLDGSDPKTNKDRILYEKPIKIDKPVTTVIRAVPRSIDFDDDWGTSSEFRYTFSTQTLKMEEVEVEKRADYEVTALLSNTTLDTRTVDVYAAVYQDGRMQGAAMEQVTLPSGTKRQPVTVHYPYDSNAQLPDDAEIKVFCLDSETQEPCSDAYRFFAKYVPVKQVLDYITVEPTSIVGEAGGTEDWPVVTAHYTNGMSDKVLKPTAVTLLTHDVDIVHSETIDGGRRLAFGKEGSTTIEFSYREGNIERAAVAQVTVVAGTRNLGFLANPAKDVLPEGAIAISNAEELAALGEADTAGKTYYLTDDIQLTGEWEPIYGFQGTLDGRGHTVSGLYISYSSNRQLAGLFASAYNAVIKNLAVEIDSRGICAYNIRGEPAYAGGLVGWLMNGPENRVVNCFSTCAVSSEATWDTQSLCIAGGLIGELESGSGEKRATVSRCYAAGDVSVLYAPRGTMGLAGIQAGGLVGSGNLLEISDCFAMGNVSIEHGNESSASLIAGGLGGWLIDTKLNRCYAAGNVTAYAPRGATCTSYIGGLTARECTINRCYVVKQKVTGTGSSNPVINSSGMPVFKPHETSEYYGFDFIDTWEITMGVFQGLPYLQYQD